MQKTYKPTILIDLDGVLNKYNGNYDKNFIPEINEKAKCFLEGILISYLMKLMILRFGTNKELILKYVIASTSEAI